MGVDRSVPPRRSRVIGKVMRADGRALCGKRRGRGRHAQARAFGRVVAGKASCALRTEVLPPLPPGWARPFGG
ncbi:hypothetical protein MINT15_39420 [Saccharomonospora viridis]|uniref:Uncharacterized protein n=1 Tax=Saccharomonospora viridis TaxID=1852 RepID=A0A837D8M7_9PSEU|nr:hypothetical protein MINT15_39420 [Saccharomonospora viridis]